MNRRNQNPNRETEEAETEETMIEEEIEELMPVKPTPNPKRYLEDKKGKEKGMEKTEERTPMLTRRISHANSLHKGNIIMERDALSIPRK